MDLDNEGFFKPGGVEKIEEKLLWEALLALRGMDNVDKEEVARKLEDFFGVKQIESNS